MPKSKQLVQLNKLLAHHTAGLNEAIQALYQHNQRVELRIEFVDQGSLEKSGPMPQLHAGVPNA